MAMEGGIALRVGNGIWFCLFVDLFGWLYADRGNGILMDGNSALLRQQLCG